jgi:predicted RNase H-like HicB family nuclease
MATRERHAVEDHLELPYRISLTRGDGGGWTARVEELEGCEATGASPEEAAAAVRAAMAEWIAGALAEGRAVPTPKSAATHSGRLLVRMPPSLHAELARLADDERVSLNTLIVGVLGGAASWRQGQRAPAATTGTEDVPSAAQAAEGRDRARLLAVALKANLVVVVVVALAAVALLVLAATNAI